MKRGSIPWDAMVRPFCSDLVFRCLRHNRSFSKATFESWSGHAAVLFVDLSGYSKITSVLADRGAYVLSKIVNDYLAELLRMVQLFGGDVVKFAGDAILVVWESDSIEQQQMNVMCAAQCTVQMQELAGNYPVEGTDLSFRIHCGLCCGALDTEVFTAPRSVHMQRLYHVVSGDPLVEIGDLVDYAKAGQICISWECADYLGKYAVFEDAGDYGKLLVEFNLDDDTDLAVDNYIGSLRKQREQLRVTNQKLEEDFIHPSVLAQLQHGGTQIAQMRNLCVLFIAKTSSGNSANWLMEIHDVLDDHRCPIVQILDDDKGVHLTAAVNLYESVLDSTKLALNACRALISKQVGCVIGMAMGGTYCGITGSSDIACRWDITGAPVVRAARLMQYALQEKLPIAIDQSVYNNAALPTMMTPFSCIRLKGSRQPTTVYVLSSSKSVAASMILENFAFAPIHQQQVKTLQEFLSSSESRGAAIVTGPGLVGKKVVCQRAAGLARIVPILHSSDATAELFQIGRTLADWFLHYCDERCCSVAREVKNHLENRRWSRAHDDCVKLINTVVEAGYRGCVVVDRIHDLDQFSFSFILQCLVAQRVHRKSTSLSHSSFGQVTESKKENGKFFFLCTHEPLYDAKPVGIIVAELVRAHQLKVPIVEVVEATREELKTLVRDSIDLGVDDNWLDINAKTSGYRPGYMYQRIRHIRVMSANLVKEGKAPLSALSEDLNLHVPDRMARHNNAVTVTQVYANATMRFGRVFDELPPTIQTFVEVITVATNNRCLYQVPLKAVTMAMEDLFAEYEEPFPVDLVVAELEEMFIIKVQGGEGECKRVYLRCPALAETVAALLTPIQCESIAIALVDRLEDCNCHNTFVDHLVIASLAGTCREVAKQQEHWKLAYSKFQEDSTNMDQKTINRSMELIEEEIEVAGGDVMKCLGIPSFEIERATFRALNPAAEILKYYSGPVTFGPMGHTLSVISRNCFKERRAFHGASTQEVATLRQDIASGVSRCREQVHVVESHLEENGFGTSRETLLEEIEILERLTQHATCESGWNEKVDLFLNHLVPEHIEPRMERLRDHVAMLRDEKMFPAVIKEADDCAIRLAYTAMRQEGDRNDAIQDALVTLASLNWAPKKVPECLPVFFYQTVATIRYRVMRKLSDGELILFRHQHIFDDLEASLILTALLPEHDRPRVI